MNVYLDIETIPSQNPAVREQIAATIEEVPPLTMPTCPKTYKKPSTIQAWHDEALPQLMLEAQQKHRLAIEKREAVIEDSWRRTALSGEHGQIVCISWAVEDEEPRVLLYAAPACENLLLLEFFNTLSEQLDKRSPVWIGHNVQFDLRFLFQRAVVHSIQPAIELNQDASPYGGLVHDTMQMWAGYRQYISLDKLCQVLRLPGKGTFFNHNTDNPDVVSEPHSVITHGSQVWDFIQENKLDDVIAYCKADVERCRAVYKRLSFAAYLNPTTWIADLPPNPETNNTQVASADNASSPTNPLAVTN